MLDASGMLIAQGHLDTIKEGQAASTHPLVNGQSAEVL